MQWKNGTRQMKWFMTSHNLIIHQMIKNRKIGQMCQKRGEEKLPQREQSCIKREEICHIWGGDMSYSRGANELGSPE